MSMFYSPSTKGFYTPNQPHTPDDVVKITVKQHQALMEKQADGEEIVFKGGKVTTQPREITWDQIRTTRNKKLARSDWSQLPDAQATMTAERADAWRAYRQALRDIPSKIKNPVDAVWPQEPSA